MENNLINFNINLITQSLNHSITFMLRNVTNMGKIRQLFKVSCFIIHVGLICIGVEAYA